MKSFPLAEIPLLDMKGPEFLLFYVVALVVAVLWSLRWRSSVLRRFEIPGAEETRLENHYEVAFLSGGLVRCSQVAITRLVKSGAVEWKRGTFSGSRLFAKVAAFPTDSMIESTLISAIAGTGSKGLPFSSVPRLVATRLQPVEARLAKLGLRPTGAERSGSGFKVVLPLVFLALLGLTKLFVGLARDKPFLFLAVLLVITVGAAILIGQRVKNLTPAGESVLSRMRDEWKPAAAQPGHTDLAAMSLGIALIGPSIIGQYDPLLEMEGAMRRDFSHMGTSSQGGGCSTSSGCSTSGGGDSGGSSGCGGGGCGGCGGGD